MQNLVKDLTVIIKLLVLLVLIFFTSSLFAQNDSSELKLNIQLRPRAEFRNGIFTPILENQKTSVVYFTTKPGWINLFEKPKFNRRIKYPGSYYLGK